MDLHSGVYTNKWTNLCHFLLNLFESLKDQSSELLKKNFFFVRFTWRRMRKEVENNNVLIGIMQFDDRSHPFWQHHILANIELNSMCCSRSYTLLFFIFKKEMSLSVDYSNRCLQTYLWQCVVRSKLEEN